MQCKINEERLIARSLKEENSKTKSNLQQELLSQRQQLEMHIAHLTEQQSAVNKSNLLRMTFLERGLNVLASW